MKKEAWGLWYAELGLRELYILRRTAFYTKSVVPVEIDAIETWNYGFTSKAERKDGLRA